jgi:alkylhydroperoxidase family enzyme
MFRRTILSAALLALVGGLVQAVAPPPKPRFPSLSSDETFERIRRESAPLPSWSRVLAASLPRTTALMLSLDRVHRAQNPLDPVLRGKLRWIAADANRCDYSRRQAEADLLRAGLSAAQVGELGSDPTKWPAKERDLVAFARKMTLAAHTVTDAEVAALLKAHGEAKVVAMVHTLAHANFQDRIFLALGVEAESARLMAPVLLEVPSADRTKGLVPARKAWKTILGAKFDRQGERPDWRERSLAGLDKAMADQKARKPRIQMPWSHRLLLMPPEMRERTKRIAWSHVSMGYQPLLTRTWFETMGSFQAEARMDPVFANSYFWVVTRSNECFY